MAQAVVLQMMRDGYELRRFHLDGSRKINRIGRGDAAHVHIDEPTASRVHAVIDFVPDGVMLTDMGAAGGTLLNGQLVHRSKLSNGDQIGIGSTNLMVTVGERAAIAAIAQDPNLVPSMVGSIAPSSGAAPAGFVQAPAAAAPAPVAVMPEMHVPPPPTGFSSLPVDMPLANPLAVSTAPKTQGWSAEEQSHSEALSDDDPIVVKMRREKRRTRILIMVSAPAVLGVLAVFGWVALQQQVPDVPEPDHYSQFGVRSPEEMARLALFDTLDVRNADDFLYYRLKKPQSLKDIAREYYGTPGLVRYIVKANPKAPSKDEILPEETEVRIPRHVRYKLKQGDTAQKIAKKFLDDPGEARRLLTQLGDPPQIWPDQEIKVPLIVRQ